MNNYYNVALSRFKAKICLGLVPEKQEVPTHHKLRAQKNLIFADNYFGTSAPNGFSTKFTSNKSGY